jgi:hypothetical protein
MLGKCIYRLPDAFAWCLKGITQIKVETHLDHFTTVSPEAVRSLKIREKKPPARRNRGDLASPLATASPHKLGIFCPFSRRAEATQLKTEDATEFF